MESLDALFLQSQGCVFEQYYTIDMANIFNVDQILIKCDIGIIMKLHSTNITKINALHGHPHSQQKVLVWLPRPRLLVNR